MKLTTEMRNPETMHIDTLTTENILQIINQQDKKVAEVIAQPAIITVISQMVEQIVASFKKGGRLFYIGAGTSGRLGVLDAAECVPTYGTDPEMVQGIIAGGKLAMTEAVEGAEDSLIGGKEDLRQHHLSANDFVLGLAASGATPYVIGALDYATEIGAKTGSFSCNAMAPVSQHAQYVVEAVVGPEVITGSTRMKAGTAEKLFLNMISTTSMIKMGKVYGNLMVDVKPTNEKLVDRAKRIISDATGVDHALATEYYEQSQHQPKVAIVMINGGVSREVAIDALKQNNDFIAKALASLRN